MSSNLTKGNNRADRIRITSDRLLLKYLLDTPDEYEGQAGKTLVLAEDECTFVFGQSGGGGLPPNADDISYDNTNSDLVSDNVQDALDELANSVITVPIASEISYDNTESGLLADDVQEALDELAKTSAEIPEMAEVIPGGGSGKDEIPVTTYTTVKWIVSVKNDINNDFQSLEILAVYNTVDVNHTVFARVGEYINFEVEVVIESGDMVLNIINNEPNDISVKMLRQPIIEVGI